MVPIKSWADDYAGAPPIRAVIIWIGAIIIGVRVSWRSGGHGRGRWFLVHVEVYPLRDLVRVGPAAAGAVATHLGVLVSRQRKSLNHVLIGAKVVEGSVAIAKYFQMDGCIADVFAIGFDSGAGCGGLDQNIISNSAVGSAFDAGWNSLAAGQKAYGSRTSGKEQVFGFHIR